MIKLVASDMDGSLLDDKKRMSPETIDIIKTLIKSGIVFAAASGRQHTSLIRMFNSVIDDIYVIAENGAIMTYRGDVIFSSVMEKELVKICLNEIYKVNGVEPLLCGKFCSYTTNPHTAKVMRSPLFQYNINVVDDLYNVDDEIIKVSLLDNIDIANNSMPILTPILQDKTEVTVSGFNCLDIVKKGVSKGTAIEFIQKSLSIDYSETLVFGDNYNDIDMFKQAYYSYAMENADEGVKKQARFIAGLNNDYAVVEQIKRLCIYGGLQ